MEAINYNNISLKVLQVVRCHRQLIKDQIGNYMTTRHEIECFCNYAPPFTSYRPVAGGAPVAESGRLPGETDLATLNRLLTPRKLLVVTAGGSVILTSPTTNQAGQRYSCDATGNGPFCEFVSAPKMIGVRHWIVHVKFITHTNDYEFNEEIPLLSNTWGSTITIDDLQYPTKVVAGTAILRTDAMRDAHITADDLRTLFLFPLERNYVRENVTVELSADGASLNWSFADVGRCYNMADGVNSPVLKKEIYRTMYSTSGSPERADAQYWRDVWTGLPGMIGGMIGGIMNVNLGAPITIAANSMSNARRLTIANLPSYKMNVRADVWGHRDSSNKELTRLSMGTCLANCLTEFVPFTLTQGEVICRQQLDERFVSSEITYSWGDDLTCTAPDPIGFNPLPGAPNLFNPAAGINFGGAILLGSLFNDYPTVNRVVLNQDFGNIGNNPPVRPFLTQEPKINPHPSSGVYSTLLEKLVVQLLKEPGDAVQSPEERVLSNDNS